MLSSRRMKLMDMRSVMLVVWALLPLVSFSQYSFDHPVKIDQEAGLPVNGLNAIGQDHRGFMWFGTWGGLCRYDGSQVKAFVSNREDPQAVYNSLITDLLVEEDRIWLTHYQGFSIFDLNREVFTNYQLTDSGLTDQPTGISQRMFDVYRDRQNEYWLSSSKGMVRVQADLSDLQIYSYEVQAGEVVPTDLRNVNRVSFYTQDRYNDSIIWGATPGGLLRLNKFTEDLSRFYFQYPDKTLEFKLNYVSGAIYHHTDGFLYVGTAEAGIIRFDPRSGTYKRISLPGQAYDDALFRLLRHIVPASDEVLWITTVGGLLKYNCQKEEFELVKKNDPEADKYYGISFIDDQDRVWFGSRDGVFLFDQLVHQFEHHSYKSLLSSSEKSVPSAVVTSEDQRFVHVMVQKGEGIYSLDRKTRQWTLTKAPTPFFEQHTTFDAKAAIPYGKGKFLVLEAKEGLFEFDPAARRLTRLPRQPEMEPHSYASLLRHSSGELYIGNDQGGLIRYHLQSHKTRIYLQELEVDSPYVSAALVRLLFEDSRGQIWIKRTMGFSVFAPETEQFHHHLTPLNGDKTFGHILNFAEDDQGRVWTATFDSKIGYGEVAHPEKGIIEKISFEDASVFVQMGKGPGGNLWLQSSEGLFKFNPKSRESVFFGKEYGLLEEGSTVFQSINDKEMFLGFYDGIGIFTPDRLRKNEELPRPYLTDFKVFDESIFDDTSLFSIEEISLSYQQNFFSIEFSAIGHSLSGMNSFRYQLKGFDADWIEAGERRFANYTNVPGGSYTFQVQAMNNEGNSNEETYEVHIHISTPWWASWWFRWGVIILIAAIGAALYRYRMEQVRREERVQAAFERKLNSVELYALRSQMNPHFIFNCLNSIDYYIIKNETRKASEYLNQFSRLIRLILQNSRSEYISLDSELEALRLYMDMERLRFKNRFAYEIQLDKTIDPEMVELPPLLIQPYVENAIWHGLMHKEGEGKIDIRIWQEATQLVCLIEDNGIGREKAQALKSRHSGKKKSVGMRITQERLNMIERLYEVSTSTEVIDLTDPISGEATGTRVVIHFPLKRRNL